MRFERIQSPDHLMYGQALALYRISFPFHEQRESASQAAILADDAYHFSLIYDGETYVGLALYWSAPDFFYVEHLCILPEKRNQQYGQRALRLLADEGKTIILEIDPPVDEISIRRKGFYERCGFVLNPYPHVHPAYHRDTPGHDLAIMSWPQRISEDAYQCFSVYLQQRVMDRSFSVSF